MSMRELLRIEMSEAQVREACEQWARERASRDMPAADAAVTRGPRPGGATVVFTKKRAPRAKNLSNRVLAALQERLIEPAEGAR